MSMHANFVQISLKKIFKHFLKKPKKQKIQNMVMMGQRGEFVLHEKRDMSVIFQIIAEMGQRD